MKVLRAVGTTAIYGRTGRVMMFPCDGHVDFHSTDVQQRLILFSTYPTRNNPIFRFSLSQTFLPETSIFPRGVRTISENCPCYFLFQRVVNSISEMTFSEMIKCHRLLN